MKEEEIVCNRWLVVSGLFLVSSDYKLIFVFELLSARHKLAFISSLRSLAERETKHHRLARRLFGIQEPVIPGEPLFKG